MSREIKFRQKLKPELSKNYGDNFHYWGYIDDAFISPLGKNDVIGDSDQFIGKQDYEGNNLYQNDIVKSVLSGDIDPVITGVVSFDEDCSVYEVIYMYKGITGYSIDLTECSWLKIGNIHENKELLNG